MWHKPCRTFHPWCLCIKTRCLLISVMLELEYFWQTMLVPRLLMPWILVSPSHQLPLYWLFMIARSLSSTRKTTEAIWGLRNDRKWKYIVCFLRTIQHIKGFLQTQQCHPKPLLHRIYVRKNKNKIHLFFRSFLNIVLWVQILISFAHLLLLCLCNIMQYFLIQLILLMLLISIIEIHFNCIFFQTPISNIEICFNNIFLKEHSVSLWPGGRLNKKDGLTRYGDSHVKDKTS